MGDVGNLPTLDNLAHRHGTDKQSGQHGYTRFYERHFEPLRHDSIKLLELGVLGGASIRMWEEYFTARDTEIHGIDISDVKGAFMHRCDATHGESVRDISDEFGPWHIVVDDASHQPRDQIASFEFLWPYVVPGGFYAIEDTQPMYGDRVYEYFGDWVREKLHGRIFADHARSDVDFVEFSTSLIIIRRTKT